MSSTLTAEQALEQARIAARAAADAARAAEAAANAAADAVASGQVGATADAAAAAAHALSGGVIDPFVFRLSIFVLAIFVGYYVVWSVTPALHTPLMAVTNAISSVIIVGGLIASAALTSGDGWIARGAGVAAVTLASVNIFGGFMVTRRMLAMYRKKERPR